MRPMAWLAQARVVVVHVIAASLALVPMVGCRVEVVTEGAALGKVPTRVVSRDDVAAAAAQWVARRLAADGQVGADSAVTLTAATAVIRA